MFKHYYDWMDNGNRYCVVLLIAIKTNNLKVIIILFIYLSSIGTISKKHIEQF